MPHVRRPKPLAASGNGDKASEGTGSKPRRRSSSENAGTPPPEVQLANSMAAFNNSSSTTGGKGSGKGSGSGSGSNNSNSSSSMPPPPAVQLANNMASSGSSSSSGTGGAGQGKKGADSTTPSPAVQLANNLNLAAESSQQQGPFSAPPAGSSSSSSSEPAANFNPADLLQQGVRAAADTAESVLTNSAAAAVGGIEAAASLTQSGISAAEAAAEDAVRGLGEAAQGSLNAAAATAGGVAGAVDGVGQAAARGGGSSRRRGGSSNGSLSSSDFETVNVRVPATAWANATREKGRVRDATLTADFDEDEVEELKVQILAAVASLDRGLAANVREARDVDRLARKLEEAVGPITLRWTTSRSSPDRSTMDKLAGTWRLIYSSGFNGGSLGGSRPGPPAAFVPTVLGQVYQVINAQTMTLDNVVELLLNYGVPQLPFLPRPEPQASPGLRLSLHHTYEVTPPSTVKIVFESTSAKAIGPDFLQGLPELGVPELPSFLKPPKTFRSATFDVSFLDSSMRITRGDRGELRIYLRDRPLNPLLPMDDSDRDYE